MEMEQQKQLEKARKKALKWLKKNRIPNYDCENGCPIPTWKGDEKQNPTNGVVTTTIPNIEI